VPFVLARVGPLAAGSDRACRTARWILLGQVSRNVEDLKHFVLEHRVYEDLRAACPAYPNPSPALLLCPDCVTTVACAGAIKS